MKQQTKKRKKNTHRSPRAAVSPHGQPSNQQQQQTENVSVLALMEAFDSISFEEASTACKQANGDINRAADILAADFSDNAEGPSTSSSVSSGFFSSDLTSGSSSSSSSGSVSEGNMVNNRKGFNRGSNKQKRVIAVTGTVSTIIGKEYVKASPGREKFSSKPKEFLATKEDAEQFLCSMLSDDCDLGMAVVRDVLCQCGNNVEKALDVLLDLSSSSYEHLRNDTAFLVDCNENVTERAIDNSSSSAESEVHDSIWGYDCRKHSEVLTSSEPPTISRRDETNIPQKVLESLFNIPTSSEHEPGTMNWRNVAKKMQLLGPAIDAYPPSDAVPQQGGFAKGAEYHLYRQSAKQHWDSMRSCYQKAAVAYSKGERQYASYLSDKGRVQIKLAREAEENASKDIFKARNKDIENVITIDFHGQHVKQAMRLLKLHLLFGTYVRSVRTLRVITGCGTHGLGKSKLKESIIGLLEKEGIRWTKENPGALLIKIDGSKEYSFLDSDSDTD
ncbi:SMR domain-containing protein At5g58720 [Mercurialis annua]|uniref:SMR domain-containing protein At5g58720 n=1 Tax=Mercurialis annua TaxID=3986 RepID=UPI00215FB138|nr:SMR domain-containing protein At5g58720 [Mercurialis annua]